MNIVVFVCLFVSVGLFCPMEALKKFIFSGILSREEETFLMRYVLGLVTLISGLILI